MLPRGSDIALTREAPTPLLRFPTQEPRSARRRRDDLPAEPIRRGSRHADPPAMHAAEVVDRAQPGEVRQLVGPALRAVFCGVRMRRRPRALRRQTEPAVAGERLFRYRPTLSKSGAPGVDEVLGDGLQAFARRQPALRRLPRRTEGGRKQDAHALWYT